MISKVIEERLTKKFANGKRIAGSIHSQFRSVTNVHFNVSNGPDRLITIHSSRTRSIPDSLVVSERTFKRIASLPVGTKVMKNKFSVSFQSGQEMLIRASRCQVSNHLCNVFPLDNNRISEFLDILDRFLDNQKQADGLVQLTIEQRKQLINRLYIFCKAFLEADMGQAVKIVGSCVGVGKGLTPSSDDMLVGIISVIMVVKANMFKMTCRSIVEDDVITLIINSVRKKTTEVSKKYLLCALEGRFSGTILNLMDAMFFGAEQQRVVAIKELASLGSTSGIDILTGIRIGCQGVLKSSLGLV